MTTVTAAAGAWLVAAAVLAIAPDARRLAAPVTVTGVALVVADVAGDAGRGAATAAALAGVAWMLAGLPNGLLRTVARRCLAAAALALCPLVGFWNAQVGVAAAALATVAGIALVAWRYPQAGLSGRRRMLWLLWGGVVTGSVTAAALLLAGLLDWPSEPGAVAAAALTAVPIGLVASAWPAISRWVEPVLTASAALLAAAAVAAAAQLLAILVLGRLPEGAERGWVGASTAAAVVVAFGYPGARRAVTDRLHHLVYGNRRAPADALAVFPSRMTRSVPLEELLLQLAELLRSAWRLSSAEVWTGTAARLELSASDPPRPSRTVSLSEEETAVVAAAGISGGSWAAVWLPGVVDGRDPERLRVAPLVHGGQVLGLLVCERRPERDPITPADDALLADLARQVALVLRNATLDSALQASLADLQAANQELRRSRTRLVAAADAERRRLESDLHDGAQQHLMTLAVKLGLAKQALSDNAGPDAAGLVDELQVDVRRAIAELRALAHGIYPPLLISGGLAEALPAAAALNDPPVTMDISELPRHSPDVEAAVYFCCLEAMQNATKHAGRHARISLRAGANSDALWFEVQDNGAGFDTHVPPSDGRGLDSMRDRIGSQGGTLVITAAPGVGTTVRGELPLA